MLTGNGIVAQAVRYVAVGLVVLAADFAIYSAILLAAPERFLAANLAGKVVGAALGFVLHRTVTFRWAQRDPATRQLLSYLAVLGFNLLLSSLLLWFAIDHLGANPYLAKLAVDIVIVGTAFLLSRLWVYRRL
ncbi:GtrA family protein [Sphingopyxis sp.]|uniref:GtrA family protein n=1 Tax=Sphingopyxis sp. TaxID=1908224 RepID=UPI002FCCA9A4